MESFALSPIFCHIYEGKNWLFTLPSALESSLTITPIMPGALKTEISHLLGQDDEQISKFKGQSSEADRLAAIEAAQDLIRKLQTPQESTINISYSVCLPSVRRVARVTNATLAHSISVRPNWDRLGCLQHTSK